MRVIIRERQKRMTNGDKKPQPDFCIQFVGAPNDEASFIFPMIAHLEAMRHFPRGRLQQIKTITFKIGNKNMDWKQLNYYNLTNTSIVENQNCERYFQNHGQFSLGSNFCSQSDDAAQVLHGVRRRRHLLLPLERVVRRSGRARHRALEARRLVPSRG